MILQKDEQIIAESRIETSLIVLYTIIGLATILVLIGIFFLIGAYASYKKRVYLTNKRLIIEGIGGTTDIPLSKIESVSIVLGNSIRITGSGGKLVDISGIVNAKQFGESISAQLQ